MYLKFDSTNTLVIEKSKFITFLKRVKTEQEYKDFLAQIRKKHYDCSHVCSALIIGNIKRSNDDGEPSGTAGAPILNVLEKHELDQICALVVRYFGGTKLGTGGLIRAYGNSISECLKVSSLIEEVELNKYSLNLNYELANKIDYFMKNQTILLETRYQEDVSYIFALEDENLLTKIVEFTKGIEPNYLGKQILQKDV